MKGKNFTVFFLSFFLIILFGCKSTPQVPPIQQPNENLDSAIVSVKRESQFGGGADRFKVFIDGIQAAAVSNGQETRFEVSNGTHTIQIKPSIPLKLSSKTLSFTAASNIISFGVKAGLIGIDLTPLDSPQNSDNSTETVVKRVRSTATDGIEGAINRAIETLINNLPDNVTVAVLSVASNNADMALFIMDEIEFQFVDSGNFTVVDRKTLEQLRSERDFHLSGEVDDSSAVSIGKMLGANIVITGSVTGSDSTQRLTLKALNVQSAQIMTMAREQF
ncbi:MAG: CsgG/HfaB family protein [Treponema sp.]|jgi:TolB-like protein|nr:CsgG/HfaB family protein [Treponema sp.]